MFGVLALYAGCCEIRPLRGDCSRTDLNVGASRVSLIRASREFSCRGAPRFILCLATEFDDMRCKESKREDRPLFVGPISDPDEVLEFAQLSGSGFTTGVDRKLAKMELISDMIAETSSASNFVASASLSSPLDLSLSWTPILAAGILGDLDR